MALSFISNKEGKIMVEGTVVADVRGLRSSGPLEQMDDGHIDADTLRALDEVVKEHALDEVAMEHFCDGHVGDGIAELDSTLHSLVHSVKALQEKLYPILGEQEFDETVHPDLELSSSASPLADRLISFIWEFNNIHNRIEFINRNLDV